MRGTDGTIYASDDFAAVLDRVTPRGTVTRGWATPLNPNGLALDPNGRWLYANLKCLDCEPVSEASNQPSGNRTTPFR